MHKSSPIFRVFLVAALLVLKPATQAFGQSASEENLVKAAFIFNFIKFVEWPDEVFASPKAPIKLCVWGANALDGALEPLAKKTAKNRPIQIHYIPEKKKTAGCHVLFVADADQSALRAIPGRFSVNGLLTIGDRKDFARNGGIIGLFRSEDRMRFAINVEAARQSGLRINSQLLKLGKIVSRHTQ